MTFTDFHTPILEMPSHLKMHRIRFPPKPIFIVINFKLRCQLDKIITAYNQTFWKLHNQLKTILKMTFFKNFLSQILMINKPPKINLVKKEIQLIRKLYTVTTCSCLI